MLLNYHIGHLVLSSLCVGDLVRLVLSGARFQAEAQIHFLCAQHVSDINISIFRSLRLCLLNYHIGHLVLSSLCVGDLVWLVLSNARVTG